MAKVYVSSTFIDLQLFREKVSLAIHKAHHEDVAMEYYTVEDRRPVDRCLDDVASCDVYVGIFAWRYGWIPKCNNPEAYSITEMEYRRADSTGKKCLIFLLDGRVAWPPDYTDDDKTRIKKLRDELAEKHGAGVFGSAEELGHLVADALHELIPRAQHRHVAYLQYLDEKASSPEFDSSAVKIFRELLRPEQRRNFPSTMTHSAFLKNAGVLVNGWLTRSGVLLFRDNPTAELVSAYVQCTRVDVGSKRRKPLIEDIHGSIHSQIIGSMDFVRTHSKHFDYFGDSVGKTIRLDEYPLRCLKEVVANALCHRDYQDRSRTVHLRMFSDYIEVLSPGEWMGNRKLSSRVGLSELKSESKARNPVLARLLTWISYVENRGGGIERALSNCVAKEAAMPTAEERDGYVVVTIFPSTKFRLADSEQSFADLSPTREELADAEDEEQLTLINSRVGESAKVAVLCEYTKRNASAARRILRNIVDLSPEATLSYLRQHGGWEGHDLQIYVSNWLYSGVSKPIIGDLLQEYTKAANDVRTLSYVYYALLTNDIYVEREHFFERCWRSVPASLKVETVRISDRGRTVNFTMGSDDSDVLENEHPAHQVELTAFWIGIAPVTVEQYSAFSGQGSSGREPVTGVTWWEAWIFCKWLGGELPTEAQWECACRAGTTTKWWFGDDAREVPNFAWVDEGDDGDPHPVCQRRASPWGLHDMHGNVEEWCLDRYGSYASGKSVDPAGPEWGKFRVLRGGNAAAPIDMSRSSSRDRAAPGFESLSTGFRIAFKTQPLPSMRGPQRRDRSETPGSRGGRDAS